MVALLTLLMLPSATFAAGARQSAVVSRPCPSSWNAPAGGAKKKRLKNAAQESQNPGACIELSFPPLEIQEFLQSYARKKHWTLLEEHLSEDSWTFSLALGKDELLAATKRNSSSEKVEWRSGVAVVQVTSAPSTEGFTRTIVRATFLGYGENADKFAVQREYWELASSGSFEASIASALQAHFKPAP